VNDRPEIPESDTLRFDEAVKLLVDKGLRDVDIQTAIERALIESRLQEMPWVIMTPGQAATFKKARDAVGPAIPTAVRSLLDEMFPELPPEDTAAADSAEEYLSVEAQTPGRFSALAWQAIIRTRRIDWATGAVACGKQPVIPMFSRTEVLALFGVRRPTPRSLNGKERFEALCDWYLNKWIPSWPDGHFPDRTEDVKAGKAALDKWVTRDWIDQVRRDDRVKPHLRHRGAPKKLSKI
jgi:hypothetical protein